MIDSSRLYITKLGFKDSDFMIKLMNQESYKIHIGDRKISSIEKANDYLREGPLLSYEQFNFGLWKVSIKSERVPIGVCGFLQRSYLSHPDIGYATLEEYHGKGLTHEAVNACLKYGKAELKLKELNAITSTVNLASINLLKKNQFQLIETKIINKLMSKLFYLNLSKSNF